MAIEKIDIVNFLELAKTNLIIDARSPGEFKHAHFPGAYNLALFTDEERNIVGTAYKQQGHGQAIKIGLDYFGVKMRMMVEEVENIVRKHPSTCILIHCWRGGMRSEAVAWLLDLYGFKVYMLKGGYKNFRHYVLETFALPFKLKLLSGNTGSGKTNLLQELSRQEKTSIDLENIANHKGSAFGAINQPPQPSQEMFENMLALKLRDSITDYIWLEDESQRIGSLIIPLKLWEQMQQSPIYFVDIPFESRLLRIELEYGKLDKEKLIEAIRRIQKRLGGLETKMAILYIEENNFIECFRILLKYYDKCYQKSLNNRYKNNLVSTIITCEVVDAKKNIGLLMQTLNKESTNNI